MLVQETMLDVTSNNLANVNSSGFENAYLSINPSPTCSWTELKNRRRTAA